MHSRHCERSAASQPIYMDSTSRWAGLPRRLCLLAMTGIILTACEPDASPQAKDATKHLIEFYGHYAIRGGWGVFGVEAHGDNIEVAMNIPTGQAEDLLKFDEDKRFRFIAYNSCPPFSEQTWSILEPKGDVIIQARMKGNVFANVPCRANNKGIPQ